MIKAVMRWFTGCSDLETKVMKEQLLLSKPVLDRLVEMLEEDIDANVKHLTDTKAFENGGYDSYIASKLGEIRAQRKLVNLLKVEVKPNG